MGSDHFEVEIQNFEFAKLFKVAAVSGGKDDFKTKYNPGMNIVLHGKPAGTYYIAVTKTVGPYTSGTLTGKLYKPIEQIETN